MANKQGKPLSERLRALKTEIRRSQWEQQECRVWLRDFLRQVELLARAVLSGGPSATQALKIICWHLGQLVMDPTVSAREGSLSVQDAEKVNEYARQGLELFGVFAQVGEAFPRVQDGGENDRLFVEEFWPSYWEWARTAFLRLDEAVAV